MTAPAFRPLLFTSQSVQNILDGIKTQTRRLIKGTSKKMVYYFERAFVDLGGTIFGLGPYLKVPCHHVEDNPKDERMERIYCPHGYPKDRIWVRETFQYAHEMGVCACEDSYVIYRATDPDWETTEGWKWRPAIFMPRSTSRILLEITDVRIERVQEISESDARAEGCGQGMTTNKHQFRKLWDSINKKRGNGWDKNDLVWVLTFKAVPS